MMDHEEWLTFEGNWCLWEQLYQRALCRHDQLLEFGVDVDGHFFDFFLPLPLSFLAAFCSARSNAGVSAASSLISALLGLRGIVTTPFHLFFGLGRALPALRSAMATACL